MSTYFRDRFQGVGAIAADAPAPRSAPAPTIWSPMTTFTKTASLFLSPTTIKTAPIETQLFAPIKAPLTSIPLTNAPLVKTALEPVPLMPIKAPLTSIPLTAPLIKTAFEPVPLMPFVPIKAPIPLPTTPLVKTPMAPAPAPAPVYAPAPAPAPAPVARVSVIEPRRAVVAATALQTKPTIAPVAPSATKKIPWLWVGAAGLGLFLILKK